MTRPRDPEPPTEPLPRIGLSPGGHGPSPHGRGLRTVSLRRRVIVSSVLVIAVVLLLLALATDLLFAAQSRRDTDTDLRTRAQLAEQLTMQGMKPQELVSRLQTNGVQAQVTTRFGQRFGEATQPTALPQERRRNGLWRLGDTTVLERRLPDGSHLMLVADSNEVTAARQRLRRLLFSVGLAALVVAAVALVLVVRFALAPLDAMTTVARSIARGDRGRRLSPTRPNTELGRTARAFDEMVDALEGAERTARHAEAQARASEGRTRQFVADAAHELRTPIAGVQAAAEAVLQSGPQGSAEERDRLHLLLVREAQRAGRLVEDLLALARIDAGLDLHPSPVDVAALARAEAARTQLLAPRLNVIVTVPGGVDGADGADGADGPDGAAGSEQPVLALADPERVAQILANLLDNARRHAAAPAPTPTGGSRGSVAASQPGSAATAPAGEITIGVARTGPWIEISVADSGPGVPPHHRERIFDRLVRLDAARTAHTGGAGLGLAIARGLARAHGGDLRCVESPTGTGALFVLTLPALPPSQHAEH